MCLFLALGLAAAQAPSHSAKVPIAPALSEGVPPDAAQSSGKKEEAAALAACAQAARKGFLKIAPARDQRFEGKVTEATALCRGGHQALLFRDTPWVDWSHYWGTGDMTSLPTGFLSNNLAAQRGIAGALLDLEYQRIELIKFNLFDNSGTYQEYVQGRNGVGGPSLKTWDALRLSSDHPNFKDVGGDSKQACRGDLIRARTLTGICNDV